MGRINDGTKYPNDEDISGVERLFGSDETGATRNFLINDVADYVFVKNGRLKNPTSNLFAGFLVIAGEGNTQTGIVEDGDVLVGGNAALTSGQLMILKANKDNPTDTESNTPGGGLDVKLNLG